MSPRTTRTRTPAAASMGVGPARGSSASGKSSSGSSARGSSAQAPGARPADDAPVPDRGAALPLAPTRTIVLWSPDWPVTAATRSKNLAPDAPIALIDRGRVFACSAAARLEGVSRGLRVREAQSRCPDLIVLPHEPIVDARAFDPVIEAIEGMIPGVQLLRPGTIAIRSRGPARYYGGEKPAALALVARLAELGIPGARVGIADGLFAAEQAARSVPPDPAREPTAADAAAAQDPARGTRRPPRYSPVLIVAAGQSPAFLSGLPVGILGDPQLVTLLRRLGVRTLGEFAALPVRDVRDRFGEPAAWLHALASGLDSRRVTARIPPQHLDVTVEFEPALDRVDQVAFGVKAAAERFVDSLTAAQLVCTTVVVEAWSESGEVSEREWLHPRSFTASDVVDRVRWQLQGGDADSGLRSGIVRVRIVPQSVDAIGNHEQGLWGTGPDERIHHGLSRVQSMLGHGAVLTATVGGGRMLAERQNFVAWGDADVGERSAQQPWPGHLPSPAPATVFANPHPVHVFAADGSDVTVDDRGRLSSPPARFGTGIGGASAGGAGGSGGMRDITAWAGPWTIDERWWDADEARSASRFQIVDSNGSAWLLVLEGGGWWLEAKYD